MPFAGETADQQAHVAHPARVEAGRGLVEDQQARAAQQRRGDAEALAHAVRVAADAVPARGVSSTISSTSSMRSRAPSPSSAASSSRFLRALRYG